MIKGSGSTKAAALRPWYAFTALSLIMLLLMALYPSRIYSAQTNTVVFTIRKTSYTVNRTSLQMDVAPYIKNNRTFLPVRYAATSLGIPESGIVWDPVLKTITLTKNNQVIQLKLGSNKMLLNGSVIRMDAAPEIVNGRTMLPLRFVAQVLGASLNWNAASQTVSLTESSSPAAPPSSQAHSGEVDIKYRWDFGGSSYTWDMPLSKEQFNQDLVYFQKKSHPQLTLQNPFDYVDTYTNDPDDDELITIVVNELRRLAQKNGFDEYQTVEFVIAFVQGFPYISDLESTGYDEYPRYPVETLLEKCGDCEDTAILAGVLLREMGYGDALLIFQGDPGHAALGLYGGNGISGSYYQYGGKRYFYVETTDSGWPIGEVPKELKNRSAIVLPLQ